jgi:sulfofructose kinase
VPHGSLLVFVGVCTMDTIAAVNGYPEPDSRSVAEALLRAGGGPAATAAVAAARLGQQAALVSAVGDDADGAAIVADLQAEGVGVEAVQQVPGAQSGASSVTIDLLRHTRAIVNRPPPRPDLDDPHARAVLQQARWVHADQAGVGVFGSPVCEASCLRSYDGGNPAGDLDVSGLDLYAPTLEQLAHDFPVAGGVVGMVRAARGAGAGRVVVTDGPRGAYAMDAGDDAVAHVPAAHGPVRSTLGAGDVFHGALVAALSAQRDLVTAVALANTVALASCSGLDGRSAIPVLDPGETTVDDLHLTGDISWL